MNLDDLEALAKRAIGEKCILDAAADLHRDTRDALADAVKPGNRVQVGTLGMVYRTLPKPTWKVTDRAALLAWAREHAPHLIVSTVVEDVTLPPLDADGEITIGGGETVRPAGVELVAGTPTLTVKPTEEARAVAAQQLRELEA